MFGETGNVYFVNYCARRTAAVAVIVFQSYWVTFVTTLLKAVAKLSPGFVAATGWVAGRAIAPPYGSSKTSRIESQFALQRGSLYRRP